MNRSAPIISGLGCISAVGRNLPETLESFAGGGRSPGPVTLFETPLANPVFEAPLPQEPGVNRTLDLAMAAVREALDEARLSSILPSPRVGVCLGTTVACQLNDFPFYRAYRDGAAVPLEPVDRYLKGNLADAVALAIGAEGPSVTVVNACSSGTDAIGIAREWIRSGLCDVAIAGGADELNRVPLCGFHALGVMSPEPCRPFDRDRQGLNLGEGAGILVLEAPDHAAARGVRATVAVAGFGAACDAHHLTAPHPDGRGLEKAIRDALAEAGIGPEEIGFVNAHGTATRDNDRVEGAVLARLTNPTAPFLSTKGYTGHTLGAAGGLEAVFTAAALQHGWIPASAGFAQGDDEIPATPVSQRTELRASHALSTSLAFGGNNAAVILRREERAESEGSP